MKNLPFICLAMLCLVSCGDKTMTPEPITDLCESNVYFQQTGFANIFAPNAFTPNGDGLNDEYSFTSGFSSGFGLDSFKIYDDLEQLIYSVTDQNDIDDEKNTWDGIVNGELYEGKFRMQIWFGTGTDENITSEVIAYSIKCLEAGTEYPNLDRCRPLDDIGGAGVDLKENLDDFPICN